MKLTLADVSNLQAITSAAATINANSQAIENAIENTLSRDGTSPNQMGSDFDMNGHAILNLPAPVDPTSPVRLMDIPTSGSPVGTGTVTSVGLSLPDDFSVTGSPVTTLGTLAATWANGTTGTGSIVRSTSPTITSPTLTAPILGSATATSINKVTVTPPATGSTLTIADAQTLSVPTSATVSGTNTGDQTITLTGDVTGSGTGSFAATIGANKVTNAQLAQAAAYTIKGNATGSSATPTDISIPALTQKASPVAADKVMIADSAASNALKYATISSIASAGSVSSIAGNTGAFTLSNGITNSTNDIRLATIATGNVLGNASGSTAVPTATALSSFVTLPTRQVFTSGTGATYTTPAGCRKLFVRMVGGGGGGGGSGTSGQGAGGTGTGTIFAGTTANGAAGNTGGAPTTNTSTVFSIGGSSGGGVTVVAAGGNVPSSGASSVFGGGSAGTPATNSGAGGGGASTASGNTGAGGGSGAYVELIINNPTTSYTYTVGAGGAAGTAGTSGNTGFAGAAGVIIVDEYYI